jgi:hypothetical protein
MSSPQDIEPELSAGMPTCIRFSLQTLTLFVLLCGPLVAIAYNYWPAQETGRVKIIDIAKVFKENPGPLTGMLQLKLQAAEIKAKGTADIEDELQREYYGLAVLEAQSLAQKQNRTLRLGSVDGESYPLTAECDFRRITAHVTNGLITSIDVEPKF